MLRTTLAFVVFCSGFLPAQEEVQRKLVEWEAVESLSTDDLEEAIELLDHDDGGIRTRVFALLRRHTGVEQREALLRVVGRDGAGRPLAAMLLTRMPKPELPPPPGYVVRRPEDLPKPEPKPEPASVDSATLEELVAILGKDGFRATVQHAAHALARRARTDPEAAAAFGRLVETAPVDNRADLMAAGAAHVGPWLEPLMPSLLPLLRSRLGGNVLQMLVGLPESASKLAPKIAAELKDFTSADAMAMAHFLAYHPIPPILDACAEQLAARCADGSTFERIAFLGALANLPEAKPVVHDAVLACIEYRVSEVRRLALLASVRLGLRDAEILAAAERLAEDEDAEVRRAVELVRWSLAPDSELAGLRRALRHQERQVVLAALVVLQSIGEPSPELLDDLRPLLGHADSRIAVTAAAILPRFGEAAHPALEDLVGRIGRVPPADSERLLRILAGFGEQGLVLIGRSLTGYVYGPDTVRFLDGLGDEARPAWIAGARAMVRGGDLSRYSLEALREQSADAGPLARNMIADPLLFLARALHDGWVPEGERRAVAREVARRRFDLRMREARAVPAIPVDEVLAELLADANPEVRQLAGQALVGTGPSLLLESWLTGPFAARTVAGALVRPSTVGQMPVWLARLRVQDPVALVRAAAAIALAEGEALDEVRDLLTAWSQSAPPETIPILDAIARRPGWTPDLAAVIEPLTVHADDEVRRAALRAAASTGAAGDAFVRGWQRADDRETILGALQQRNWLPAGLVPWLAEVAVRGGEGLERFAWHLLFQSGISLGDAAETARVAADRAWKAAPTWAERAQLTEELLAAGLDLGPYAEDLQHMLGDGREEVRWPALTALAAVRPSPELAEVLWREVRDGGRQARPRAWRVLASWRGELPAGADLFARKGPGLVTELRDVLPVLTRLIPMLDPLAKSGLAEVMYGSFLIDGTELDRLVECIVENRELAKKVRADNTGQIPEWLGLAIAEAAPDLALELALLRPDNADALHLLTGIGQTSSPSLAPELKKLLDHDRDSIQTGAAIGLRCGGVEQFVVVRAWAEKNGPTHSVLGALSAWGEAAAEMVPWLHDAYSETEDAIKYRVLQTLVRLGPGGVSTLAALSGAGVEVGPALLLALGDPDDAVSETALRVVISLHRRDILHGMRYEPNRSRRWQTWRALAFLELREPEEALLPLLASALQADEPLILRRALQAIALRDAAPGDVLPVEGWAIVVEALEHPDAGVRFAAAEALLNSGLRWRLGTVITERLAVETEPRARAALEALR